MISSLYARSAKYDRARKGRIILLKNVNVSTYTKLKETIGARTKTGRIPSYNIIKGNSKPGTIIKMVLSV